MSSDVVRLNADQEDSIREYLEARAAATAWFNRARELRHQLMEKFPKPPSDTVNVLAGDVHVEVVPVTGETVDMRLLKDEHPDVYRACLTRNTSYHIREVKSDGE